LYREILEIKRRVLGPEHKNTLTSMFNLAWTLQREGRYADAEKLQRETLEIQRRVLGPEHSDTLVSMNNLADNLSKQRRFEDSSTLQRQTLEIQRRVLGPEHPDTAISVYNLGCLQALAGKPDEALGLLREAVDHGLPREPALGMGKDPDLKSLQGDPRFAALVAYAKDKVAAASKTK
jgi:tetratricopeptide (TPR) repeat protein